MNDHNPKLVIPESDVKQTLEATYDVNKLAKSYASNAKEAYNANNHDKASQCSIRKAALYRIKESVLNAILNMHDELLVEHCRHQIHFYGGNRILHHLTFEMNGTWFEFHYESDRDDEFLPEWVDESESAEPYENDQDDSIDINAIDHDPSIEGSLRFLAQKGFNPNDILNPCDEWECLEDIDTENLYEDLCDVNTCPNEAIWMHHYQMNVCDKHKITGVHDNHCHVDEF